MGGFCKKFFSEAKRMLRIVKKEISCASILQFFQSSQIGPSSHNMDPPHLQREATLLHLRCRTKSRFRHFVIVPLETESRKPGAGTVSKLELTLAVFGVFLV